MNKSNKYGILGSIVFCGIIVILLMFIFLPGKKAPEDEGIMVSFGESVEGSGREEIPASKPIEKPIVKTPPPAKPVKQELMTQTDNSLAIEEQKKKEKVRKEQEAIEKQRAIEERRIAEQKRKEQDAIDKANTMNGMFGNSTSSGSGTSSGDTQQGNPVGKGSSGGNSWSLGGRNLMGSLVRPAYNQNVEGKITVTIRVDQNGNVTSASIGTPTTISDVQTRNAAIDAARNTRFTKGKDISTGSITYNFKLN